jgi:hypothetical protein
LADPQRMDAIKSLTPFVDLLQEQQKESPEGNDGV